MKTIAEIASDIHRPASSISRVARRLGITKRGRDYQLTEAQARLVVAHLRDGPGKPPQGK